MAVASPAARRRALDRALRFALPAGVALMLLVVWEVGVFHWLLRVETYTLAYPTDIAAAISDDLRSLGANTWITFQQAFAGYVIGSAAGFLLAVALCEWSSFRRAVLPVISGLTAMPVIALAPLMVLYFGFGMASKIAVVVVMTLPPMTVTTFKGLSSIETELESVLRSYASARLDLLTKLRVPWSLPFVFTGLKLNVTLSLIGTLIAEFFSARAGLGSQMSYALDTFNMPVAWGTMLIAALMGVLWYQVVVAGERLAVPWHTSIRKASE